MTNALIQLQNFACDHRGGALLGSVTESPGAVLRQLNITIDRGEKIALVGPSGAGKSTLLSALYLQLRTVTALCPQQLGLVDSLSCYHNIYMAQLERHSTLFNLVNLLVPKKIQVRQVQAITDQLGLTPLLFTTVSKLSGGERQRVAAARALYRGQTVFMGDEPVSNLDPLQGEQVLAHLLEQHETSIVALHDPQLALTLFDRIIGLRCGEVAFDQTASSLSHEQLSQFYSGH
jgi:ABC-type phosphate/phosphonate transport system, ATPase component